MDLISQAKDLHEKIIEAKTSCAKAFPLAEKRTQAEINLYMDIEEAAAKAKMLLTSLENVSSSLADACTAIRTAMATKTSK